MRQQFPGTQTGLLAMTATAIAGATRHAATVPLAYNNAAALSVTRAAAELASTEYGAGVTVLRQVTRQFKLVAKEARTFATLARDVLKPQLGRQHHSGWVEVGFERNLVIPMQVGDLERLLGSVADYFAAHPEDESVSSGVTATAAADLHDRFSAARQALKSERTDVRALRAVRRTKFAVLTKQLRALAKELTQHLSPSDERWLDFGLCIPGVQQKPPTPEKPSTVAAEDNRILVQWPPVPRAKHYRVWKRKHGSTEAMVPIASVRGLDFLLEGVSTGTQSDLAISAVNSGGESGLSEIVTLGPQIPGASGGEEAPVLIIGKVSCLP